MYIERIHELGYDQSDLHIKPIEPLIPNNMSDVISFFNCLSTTESKTVILWDVDTDGVFAGYTAYKLSKKIDNNLNITNYVNETKMHGITEAFISYCKREGMTHVIIVDSGTNDVEEIKELNEYGIKVLVIDHHVKTKEYINPDFILVNSHDLDFGQNVSGAYLTNEVLKQVHIHYHGTNYSYFDEMAVISIVSDLCDKDDAYNKNCILHFILGKFQQTDIVKLFRRSYTKNTIAFIISMTSVLNAIIRFHGSRVLMQIMLNDLKRLASIINNKKLLKETNEEIVLEILRKSQLFEMSNLIVAVLSDELPDRAVIIRNYLGIIASKLSSKYKKMCLVLGNKKINYENTREDYRYCFSARDYYNRNSLLIGIESGINGEGHDKAWGGHLPDDYSTILDTFNCNLEVDEIEEFQPIIRVNNILYFLEDIKTIAKPLSLWNSISSDEKKIKVEFRLMGQITKENSIQKILYGDYQFKTFDKDIAINDKVQLTVDYNGDVDYLVKKVN